MSQSTRAQARLKAATSQVAAEQFLQSLGDPLPQDPDLLQGQLSTGLKYYIRANASPKDRATAWLVVRIGSLVELESERGLAHFLEHLAFRGTSSYDHGELIKFFERAGIAFGKHMNAHTSLEETVYKLEIPLGARDGDSDQFSLLRQGIDVMREWASEIRISDADVESERNIIIEEWRGREGPASRMLKQYWKKIFADGGSNTYASRWPIGLLSVVQNATPDQIRSFYRRWYRPEHMAVVICGDFKGESAAVQSIVQDAMASFHGAEASAAAVPTFPLPSHSGRVSIALADSELTSTAINLEFFEKLAPTPDAAFSRVECLKRLFTSSFDRRLRLLYKGIVAPIGTQPASEGEAKSDTADLPILTANVGMKPIIPSLLRTTVSAWAKKGRESQALQFVVDEFTRLIRYGFDDHEIAIARDKWIATFEQMLHDPSSVTSRSVANELKQHFLLRGALAAPGSDFDLRLAILLLRSITASDVNDFCRQRFDFATYGGTGKHATAGEPGRFYAICTQVLTKTADAPIEVTGFTSDAELDATFQAAWDRARDGDRVGPWPSDVGGEAELAEPPLCAKHDVAHNSARIEHLPGCGAQRMTLSNGIRVCWKRTPWKADRIQFQAFALRGRTELDAADDSAFSFLPAVAQESPLGNLSGPEVADLRSRKGCNVSLQRHYYHRGIGGSCRRTEDLELLCRMIHYQLDGSQRLSKPALNMQLNRAREQLRNKVNVPEAVFMEDVQRLFFGDVPLLRPLTEDMLDSITIERVQLLYEQAFVADPSQFVFCFVGAIPEDGHVFCSLMERYLGSLPAGEVDVEPDGTHAAAGSLLTAAASRPERWSQRRTVPSLIGVEFPTSSVQHSQQARIANKASTVLAFPIEEVPVDDVPAVHLLKSAAQLLRARLLSTVRQQQGEIYSISVGFSRNCLSPHGAIVLSFDCDPQHRERVQQAILAQVRSLQEDGPSADEISAVVAIQRQKAAASAESNSHWVFHLLDSFKVMEKLIAMQPKATRLLSTASWIDSQITSRLENAVRQRGDTMQERPEILRDTFRSYMPLERVFCATLDPVGEAAGQVPAAAAAAAARCAHL